MDPHTFSEGNWVPQAYINSLHSPSEKVCGSIGLYYKIILYIYKGYFEHAPVLYMNPLRKNAMGVTLPPVWGDWRVKLPFSFVLEASYGRPSGS